MAIDPESPLGEAFQRLARELHDRRTGRDGSNRWNRGLLRNNKVERPGLDLLYDYFKGDPPLRSDIHSGWKPYVRAFLRAGRFNIATKTVTARSNRMDLRGFRTSATEDEHGDQLAYRIMQANDLSLVVRDVHDTFLWAGTGYAITQPPPAGEAWPIATAEDPRQVITAHDPLTGRAKFGLKLFRDDWDAADFAYVYTRTANGAEVQKLRHEGRSIITDGPFRLNSKGWELDGDVQMVDRFPVHRFRNRFGVGEFEWHLDTLDRINDKVFNEWWIAKIQAFRQRAVKNLPDTETVVKTDGSREEVEIDYSDMFTASPDEMWQVPGDVEFWESQPIDMTPITAAVQKDLERYASAVDLPLHIITPDAANGSAEGATLMREESVVTVEDRQKRVDPEWRSVMADLFSFVEGDNRAEAQARADVTLIECDWAPIERYSLEQRANAASQVAQVYPREAIWTDVMQVQPNRVPDLRSLAGRDLLFQPPQIPAPPEE